MGFQHCKEIVVSEFIANWWVLLDIMLDILHQSPENLCWCTLAPVADETPTVAASSSVWKSANKHSAGLLWQQPPNTSKNLSQISAVQHACVFVRQHMAWLVGLVLIDASPPPPKLCVHQPGLHCPLPLDCTHLPSHAWLIVPDWFHQFPPSPLSFIVACWLVCDQAGSVKLRLDTLWP